MPTKRGEDTCVKDSIRELKSSLPVVGKQPGLYMYGRPDRFVTL